MQKKIVSLAAPFVIGVMALAFGWFAHAALPLAAQGIVADERAALSAPAGMAAPSGTAAQLTYQGRLTNSGGTPLNTSVNVVFKLYDATNTAVWTSTVRSVTPSNGLFTVYLGDGADPSLDANTLATAASVGVTVGSDAEMTPRQRFNTVFGHSDSTAGVVGSSTTAYGIYGETNAGVGVLGLASDASGIGVAATGAVSSSIALQVYNGGIKVAGAGIGTNTAAFIHQSTISNTNLGATEIDNVLTNGDQNAMLLVTQVFNPAGAAPNNLVKSFGVAYNPASQRWAIFLEDFSSMPPGINFNVMVIKR